MDTVEGLQTERRRSTFSSGWRAFKHLTTLGYPRRFPVVQFPNLPLIVALVAGQGSRYLRGYGTCVRAGRGLLGYDDLGL